MSGFSVGFEVRVNWLCVFLGTRPTPKVEVHHLSAVSDRFFFFLQYIRS